MTEFEKSGASKEEGTGPSIHSSQRDRVYGEDDIVWMEKERVEEIMICALYLETKKLLPPAEMEKLLKFLLAQYLYKSCTRECDIKARRDI